MHLTLAKSCHMTDQDMIHYWPFHAVVPNVNNMEGRIVAEGEFMVAKLS